MAYNRKPNYHFKTVNDTGIDEVPVGAFIVVEDFNGESKTFTKTSDTGLTSSSTIADANLAGVLVEEIGGSSTTSSSALFDKALFGGI